MNTSPPPFADLAAADGVVSHDLPCRKCAYNLRGLQFAGQCPECGTPVVLSAQSDMLRSSDPRWVSQLAWGATLLFIATLFVILGAAIPYYHFGPLFRSMSITSLISVPAAVAMTAAVWLITQPDPARRDSDVNLRIFLRAAAIFLLASRFL